ncbi:hypothetical protein [Paludibacterium paludis]|uniref:Uncharacterized protein n=1 Tax=Paludibacterium paludis TaxID=1225769 RepID=A0A918P1T0_9NEIS|nr:hypothetical protein [Paludibacterium paludis]GGY13914.1 hypothetical protein GCM10011289_16590 [Paludibacterium paludis]
MKDFYLSIFYNAKSTEAEKEFSKITETFKKETEMSTGRATFSTTPREHAGHRCTLKDLFGAESLSNEIDQDEPQAKLGKNASAEISAATIAPKQIERDSAPAGYSKIAANEIYLLTGIPPNMQPVTFDAGHLIGDQLIGGLFNSNKEGNITPQITKFNTPAYVNALENPIKNAVDPNPEKHNKTNSTEVKNKENHVRIEYKVDLEYDSDFIIPTKKLVYAKIIKGDIDETANKITINKKTFPINHEVKFNRSIPSKWSASAKSADKKTPIHIKTTREAKTFKNLVKKHEEKKDLSNTPEFKFTLEHTDNGKLKQYPINEKNRKDKNAGKDDLHLNSITYIPTPKFSITKEDAILALKKTFPYISENEIIELFANKK